MVQRHEQKKLKSAMVVTSSIASCKPLMMGTTYDAVKVFVNYLTEGLFTELRGKVDCVAYCPGGVTTKLA